MHPTGQIVEGSSDVGAPWASESRRGGSLAATVPEVPAGRGGRWAPDSARRSATRWNLEYRQGGPDEDRTPHRRGPHPRVTGSRPPSLVAARGEGHISPRGGGGGCGLSLLSGGDDPPGDCLRHRLVGGVASLLSAVGSQAGGARRRSAEES